MFLAKERNIGYYTNGSWVNQSYCILLKSVGQINKDNARVIEKFVITFDIQKLYTSYENDDPPPLR